MRPATHAGVVAPTVVRPVKAAGFAKAPVVVKPAFEPVAFAKGAPRKPPAAEVPSHGAWSPAAAATSDDAQRSATNPLAGLASQGLSAGAPTRSYLRMAKSTTLSPAAAAAAEAATLEAEADALAAEEEARLRGAQPPPRSASASSTAAVAVGAAGAPPLPSSLFDMVENDLHQRSVRMTNFPASWVQPSAAGSLHMKIKNLLEKLGKLEQPPLMSRTPTGFVVANATFMEVAMAQAVVQTLHGVDNRTEADKKKVNHRTPTEHEKFSVQIVAEHDLLSAEGLSLPAQAALASTAAQAAPASASAAVRPATHAAPTVTGKRLCITRLPKEWTVQDIQELCGQYGQVQAVDPKKPGTFEVAFDTQKNARTTALALDGLKVQNDTGKTCTLSVQVMPEEGSIQSKFDVHVKVEDPYMVTIDSPTELVPSADDKATKSGKAGSARVAAATPAAAVVANADRSAEPLLVYVDELELAAGEPGSEDREIFLRYLPLEDFSALQLREWLDGFGKVENVTFLKDPLSKQLTGSGYVRFATHEQAVGLLEAFPSDGTDDDVQGSWSMSERVLRAASGYDALEKHAKPLRSQHPQLQLVGEGRGVGVSADVFALGIGAETGPVHFATFLSGDAQRQALRAQLKAAFSAALQEADSKEKCDVKAEQGAQKQPSRPQDCDQIGGEADEPMSSTIDGPCILVRNFPKSWRQQQIKLVFALFGGVSAVRFVQESGGKRSAHVELKNPENLGKAVDQLDNTSVGDGDLIEECTISCELSGVVPVASQNKDLIRRSLFLDELAMSKRPKVPASESEREIYLQNLPVKDCNQEQINGWLEGFGDVEDVLLILDPVTSEPTGTGYARFTDHKGASACIEAQASVDPADGDVLAAWSESERALQRTESIYGLDVHSVFAESSGRVLASIVTTAGMKELWFLSEKLQLKGSLKPAGKQLHFAAVCTNDELLVLRDILTRQLELFHEKVAKRIKTAQDLKAPALGTHPVNIDPTAQGPPAWWGQGGANSSGWNGPPPTPASGSSWHPNTYGGYTMYGAGGGGGAPPILPGGAAPHSFAPDRPPGVLYASAPATRGSGEETSNGGDRGSEHANIDPDVHSRIEKGVALCREGKALADNGHIEKALEKYSSGLKSVLDRIGQLGDGDPRTTSLRIQVNEFLEDSAKLKERLSERDESKSTKASPDDGAHGLKNGSGGGREGHGESPATRAKTDAEPHAKDGAGEDRRAKKRDRDQVAKERQEVGDGLPDDTPPQLRERIEKGEALIKEAQKLEGKNSREEAYEKYCQGLQFLLEIMPELGENNAHVRTLRTRISKYLEQAEKLKETLDVDAPSTEQRPPSNPPEEKDQAHRGDPPKKKAARSRDRHREHKRRGSRSRDRDGHGDKQKYKTKERSRSRHGTKRKERADEERHGHKQDERSRRGKSPHKDAYRGDRRGERESSHHGDGRARRGTPPPLSDRPRGNSPRDGRPPASVTLTPVYRKSSGAPPALPPPPPSGQHSSGQQSSGQAPGLFWSKAGPQAPPPRPSVAPAAGWRR